MTGEGSAGSRGESVLLGTDLNLNDRHSLYGSYTYSTDRTDGERGIATVGQRSRVSNQVQAFTENQFTHGERQSGLAHVFGLDFAPAPRWQFGLSLQRSSLDDVVLGSIEREAGTMSASYRQKGFHYTGKVEARRDRGDVDRTQWLTTNQAQYKASPSFTLLGGFDLSVTRDRDSLREVGRFVEGNAGLAYRPVYHDRLNLLAKYTYLYDLPTEGQDFDRTDERSHVASLEGTYRLWKPLSVGGKGAYKQGEIRVDRNTGDWFRTRTYFAAARVDLHLIRNWDALFEYRWLDVIEAESVRHGALTALYRHLGDHLKIGVGYNFTDFNDDLTRLDYNNHGWFVNLVGKF